MDYQIAHTNLHLSLHENIVISNSNHYSGLLQLTPLLLHYYIGFCCSSLNAFSVHFWEIAHVKKLHLPNSEGEKKYSQFFFMSLSLSPDSFVSHAIVEMRRNEKEPH